MIGPTVTARPTRYSAVHTGDKVKFDPVDFVEFDKVDRVELFNFGDNVDRNKLSNSTVSPVCTDE